VGSSFKPYVLATAIKQGMDAQDSVLNGYSPIWIPPSTNRADQLKLSSRTKPADPYGYWQCCTDDASVGPLNVVQATAISSDPGFEDLAHRVGVYNVLDTVNEFGVGQNPFNANGVNDFTALNNVFGPRGSQGGSVTIALGQGELTAIEQASTFATLADDGTYVTPHVISQLSENGQPIPVKITRRQVLTPTQAADADYALSFANRSTYSGDTAFPAAAWDRPVVGKTGTTQTAQSAWFIGAIPQYSLAVTLYTNEQNSTGTGETLNTLPAIGGYNTGGYGGGWPATIWDTFMTQEFANLPIQQLPTPDYAGFSKWVQVAAVPVQPKPHPTTTCKPGHSIFPCNPSPNPTHTCNPFGGQPCTSTSPGPNPSPSCNPDTEPCTSTSPLATADQNAVTTALVTSPADAESEAMAARRVSSAGRKASG
jgi:membrane peptidoglycan carboxypeptidase